MPESGKSGSVGALGEKSPGATRPFQCWRNAVICHYDYLSFVTGVK